MGVTVTNLIAGPADLYIGNFGATEPADSAVASAPASATWTDLGGTREGVKLIVEQEYMKLEADQSVDRLGSRLTSREVRIETSLAEITLANIQNALNAGTIASSASFATYDPPIGDSAATQTSYKALIFDGWAPGASPFRRRVIVRKIISAEGVGEVTADRENQSVLPVVFVGHYVSASTRIFHIVDQTA